ncbi:MAG: hypothetical protein HUK12_04640 [Muribaculaceae bacterium]|nr:hypothetical protein [Muribaculaceae bacterium]MCF0204569.1 hypothetical protein [Muribaculaceae bacterium]
MFFPTKKSHAWRDFLSKKSHAGVFFFIEEIRTPGDFFIKEIAKKKKNLKKFLGFAGAIAG